MQESYPRPGPLLQVFLHSSDWNRDGLAIICIGIGEIAASPRPERIEGR